MKKILLLGLVYVIGISCVSYGEYDECNLAAKVLLETLNSDFFENFTEDNKVNILIKNNQVKHQLDSCKNGLYRVVDIESNYNKLLKIEEYRNIGETVRMQINCIDRTTSSSFLYSTSYIINKDGSLKLNDNSPYIEKLN